MGIMRSVLVFLHTAYLTVVAAVGSLFWFAGAFVCVAIGVHWINGGLPGALGLVAGGAIILFGVSCFFHALPGITPGPRTGHYGDARTARRRDVRRSGIFTER